MWYLILALLLWGYLLVKLGSEKLETKEYRDRNDKAKKGADEFFKRYSIPEYEWDKLTHWFEINNQDMRNKYYNSIETMKAELLPVIGIKPTNDMVYWGLLAKQGKIPPATNLEFFHYENPLSFDSVHGFDYCAYDYTPEERQWFRLNYLKWYDKTIRENGMEYKLVYARASLDSRLLSDEIGYIEDISHNVDPFCIIAYWEPLRSKAKSWY